MHCTLVQSCVLDGVLDDLRVGAKNQHASQQQTQTDRQTDRRSLGGAIADAISLRCLAPMESLQMYRII